VLSAASSVAIVLPALFGIEIHLKFMQST